MSLKFGQDSQKETGIPVPSLGPALPVSSEKSTISEDKSSLVPLGHRIGDLRSIKNQLTDELTNVAERGVSKLTDEQKRSLAIFLDNTSRGHATSLGMICTGKRCPFLSGCRLNDIGAPLPIGYTCPLESSILTLWINKHLKFLGIDDPDDPVHSFDMDMLYELAGQELIRWRCSVHLSDNPALVSNQQVGATQQGEPIFADVINPVLDVMERSGRNIAKIREALVATREGQLKAGQHQADPSHRAAELREKALKLAKDRTRSQEKVRDANFKVKDEPIQ